MIQYGDIRRLSGYDLEPVDLIVGGSPCQNFSIAGNRQGLEGSESGLFLEMIRIIKEMRKATNGDHPKFILLENVPGIFSSNSGNDFSAVLTEFIRILEPGTPDVPCPQDGWPKAGIIFLPNGSLAWRTHDAQLWGRTIRDSDTGDVLFMGTPQRRRRVSVIVDLRGQSAPEILFESTVMRGNPQQSQKTGEDPARTASQSTGVPGGVRDIENEPKVYDSQIYHDFQEMTDVCQSVHAQYGTGGNNMPFVVNERGNDSAPAEDQVAVLQGLGDYKMDNVASSLKQRDYKDATDLVCGEDEQVIRTVRRLTPLECERLQGYPDEWTNIPGASDSKRFKALGNSICLPFWEWLARRFTRYGNVRTIGSLFAGIGGFELVFHRAGCETLWNSEIDNFCQQVVKYHHDKGEL